MKRLRVQVHKLNVIQISVILLIIGLFLGVLCANVLKANYIDQMQKFEDDIFLKISAGNIDYTGFLGYVLRKNFSRFIIFWLLSITILGVPYMVLKVTSFGFYSGFFISAITMQYGWKGLVLVLAYFFPQGLLYVPIALLCLYKGFELCRTIYSENRNNFNGIAKLLKSYLFIILLLAVALFIASLLEAYPGAYLLKRALGSFT